MKFPEEEIVKMYLQGFDTVYIGKLYNTYNTSIRRVLLRHNVPLRGSREVQTRVSNLVFQSPVLSREESYWLGMLVTDGCISNDYLSLSLQEQDLYQLEKFAKFLGDRVKVNKQFNKKYKIFEYQVKAKDFNLIPKIRLLANFYNKSIDLQLYVPLNYDILRGIIDGDGSIGTYQNKTRVQICSASSVFINQLKDFLKQEEIDFCLNDDTREFRKNTLYVISIHKQKQILSLYHKLYNDTDLYLNRKKLKFKHILEKYKVN